MPQIIEERVLDNVVITDANGMIIWNAAQMDSPVIRRKYDDGTIDVIAQKDGRVISPPYDPTGLDLPKCQHCGERPW